MTETDRYATDRATADVMELAGTVHVLEDTVTQLAREVQGLTSIPPARAPGGGVLLSGPPWSLRAMTAERRRTVLADLADWLNWLHGRYPVAEAIPGCWWRHPEVVEELLALRAAWGSAYEDPQAPPQAAADWHDRLLPGALARIPRWGIKTCLNGGRHVERPAAAYGRAIDDQTAFEAAIDQAEGPHEPAASKVGSV
ncbi:MAG: hypothetical protein ACRDOY_05945 [Nocardioidaceae bacterium]